MNKTTREIILSREYWYNSIFGSIILLIPVFFIHLNIFPFQHLSLGLEFIYAISMIVVLAFLIVYGFIKSGVGQ